MPRAPKPINTEGHSAAQLLAEHYQKTNELTYELRQQRDRFFVLLLAALTAATLFNFDANSSNSLLIASVVKFLEIKDPSFPEALKAGPILEIIQTILLAIVFYLMGNLYQRTASVLRNFQYLGAMEREIRDSLGITEPAVSFSREGGYYWEMRQEEVKPSADLWSRVKLKFRALDLTKYFYTIFLALLLFFSFTLRIKSDIATSNWILATVDALIGIPTFIYWWNYAHVSQDWDKSSQKAQVGKN